MADSRQPDSASARHTRDTRGARPAAAGRAVAYSHADSGGSSAITDQIDHLLEKVLLEAEASGEVAVLAEPLRDPLDDEDADQRIVITGIGLITPFGIGIEAYWQGVIYGESAIGRIHDATLHDLPVQIAGQVPNFVATEFLARRDARRMTRTSQFAVAAAQLAVEHAGLVISEASSDGVGTIIGSSGLALAAHPTAADARQPGGASATPPWLLPLVLPQMPASHVAMQLGLRGYTSAIATAGVAGAQAIAEAAAVIQRGDADIMLAGGSDAAIGRLAIASLARLRLLSTRNTDPAHAARPFDRERDGFVLAEGAAVVVLERLSYARERGATIYGELRGSGSTSDAYHVMQPEPAGNGLADAMHAALHRARLDPQQIDCISAHAAGTRLGDRAEARAIKQVFDEYATAVPVSAPKSMIGHTVGAAGAIGAVTALLSLRHQLIPPTINLSHPDVHCDLDHVTGSARAGALQTVLINACALGGLNTVLIFGQVGESNE